MPPKTPKINVHDLLGAKGSRKWLQLHVDTAAEAAACAATGIVVLSCEADHSLPGIRAAAPEAMISAGMPHGMAAQPPPTRRCGRVSRRCGRARMRFIARIRRALSRRWPAKASR